ncbi:MAG: hypothetical protein ACT4P7_23030 [Gemmatimonadaceae bacterium]
MLALSSGAAAQSRPVLTVMLPSADSLGSAGPVVRSRNIISDRRVRELMDHGFPARLRYRVELWSTAGLFDRQLQAVEWDVAVRFDPLRRMFDVVRVIGDAEVPLGVFRRFADAAEEVERPYQPTVRVTINSSSLYYNVRLTLEMLSVGDLDELQRWVKGDLSPAVRGQRNPGTALSRGARTLLSRLLGGERRILETRSDRFRIPR